MRCCEDQAPQNSNDDEGLNGHIDRKREKTASESRQVIGKRDALRGAYANSPVHLKGASVNRARTAFSMDQRTFVHKRSGVWERLELLMARMERRGLRRLDSAELFELGKLYRWATSDLAYSRGRQYDADLQLYLNRLVARAHAVIYGATAEAGWTRIARFFAQTFPAEFRTSWPYVAACAALTIGWAVIAYAIVSANPANAYALLPDSIVPPHISKSLHDSNFAFDPHFSAAMSAFIITNNIKVAIFAFAAGIVTLGIFTIYEITLNGLMLGALAALFTRAGFGADFWATISPHGVIELTAIQIAGAAGLLIAAGVLNPGRLRRRDAIAQSGRRAGILIAGVVGMLCVAGIIEGFFSPLRFPIGVRAAVGAFTALGLVLYFSCAGRSRATTSRVVSPADSGRSMPLSARPPARQ